MEDGIQALQPGESVNSGRRNRLALSGYSMARVWERLIDWAVD